MSTLPNYGQITSWLGDGWEVCDGSWETFDPCGPTTSRPPWLLAAEKARYILYLRRKSDGQRVTVKAPNVHHYISYAWWQNCIFKPILEHVPTSPGGFHNTYHTLVTWLDPEPSDVVTLGELEVGERFRFASDYDRERLGIASKYDGEFVVTSIFEIRGSDGSNWGVDKTNSQVQVRRLPKEQHEKASGEEGLPKRPRGTKAPVSDAHDVDSIRYMATAQQGEMSGGARGILGNADTVHPRWFSAPASKHAALEATLAEQVRSGGHDTEYSRRCIWNKEQLKNGLVRPMSRFELPSEQRAMVKRWR